MGHVLRNYPPGLGLQSPSLAQFGSWQVLSHDGPSLKATDQWPLWASSVLGSLLWEKSLRKPRTPSHSGAIERILYVQPLRTFLFWGDFIAMPVNSAFAH